MSTRVKIRTLKHNYTASNILNYLKNEKGFTIYRDTISNKFSNDDTVEWNISSKGFEKSKQGYYRLYKLISSYLYDISDNDEKIRASNHGQFVGWGFGLILEVSFMDLNTEVFQRI